VDSNFDGVIDATDAILVPYNPNADDSVPQNLGNLCVDFGAGTTLPVTVGKTLHFLVDNSFPGGAPRTPGYWKNWNTCTTGGQAATAAANGGWQEGYWLLDDVLDPTIGGGIVWDDIQVDDFIFTIDSCELGVNILGAIDNESGANRNSDAAYTLAKHLFAAQLNFAAGAETCTAATDAALAGETLLDSINFDGDGVFLASNDKRARAKYNEALALAKTLDLYNNGELCGMVEDEPVVPPVEPPPAASEPISVFALADSSSKVNKNNWLATVVVTIDHPLAGVVVTGNWNGVSVTCTTDQAGMCTVSTNVSTKKSSITFYVTDLVLMDHVYAPSAITEVTVNKP